MMQRKYVLSLVLSTLLLSFAVQSRALAAEPVLLPNDADPTVAMSVSFSVGSMHDPVGKEGLAWVTGTLLAEGGTRKNSYKAILDALYPMATGYGVTVDREMTTVSGRVHRDHVDAFMTLFTHAWTMPAFAKEDFERVRSNALNYVDKSLRYASDEELGKAVLHAEIFGGTRYAHPIEGTVTGLKNITLADVKMFYREHFNRNRATIGLAGGFDATTKDRLMAAVHSLDDGDQPRDVLPFPPRIEGRRVVLVDKPGADASISFGFPIEARRGDRDFYALWIATSWLGEHRNQSSHLFKVIREVRGMNYGDYAYIEAFPNGGRRSFPPVNVARNRQLFQVWVRTLRNDWAHFALRAAVRELEALVDNGMTAETFELTRSFLKNYILHYADTTSRRLGYAMDDRFFGIREGHLRRFVRMMDELTLDDVNNALKRHFDPKNMVIAVITGDAPQLATALSADAPSPVTYPTAKDALVLDEDEKIAGHLLGLTQNDVNVVSVDTLFSEASDVATALNQ